MLEKLANLGTLALVVVAIVFAATHWSPKTPTPPENGYKVGQSLQAPVKGKTLFLVTRSTCGYCVQSLPQYARLTAQAKARGIEVLAVSVGEEVTVHAQWLLANHVVADRVVTPDWAKLTKIAGTPTTLVVSADRKVLGYWPGRITEEMERQVLALLGPS